MSGRAVLVLLVLAAWPPHLRGQEMPRRHHTIPRDLPNRLRRIMRLPPRPDQRSIEQQIRRLSRPAQRPEPSPREQRSAERKPDEGPSPLQGLLLVMLMAGAVGVVLVLAIRYVIGRDRGGEPVSHEVPGVAGAEETLARGRRFLEQGQAAQALRLFYLHAVSRLKRVPGLAESPHLSDAFILRRIREDPLKKPFQDLSRLFQPIRYGGRPADLDAARRAHQDAEAIDEFIAGEREDGS